MIREAIAGVATALKIVGYVTAAIEDLVVRGGGEMGLGGGQSVLARDEHDPDAPLVHRRIVRTYERTAYHLQVLTLADAVGRRQTLRVTDEHPFRRHNGGWTKSKLLETGDGLLGPAEIGSSVTGNSRQSHPAGVAVYNLEVAGSHTYFVRAEDSDAEPVWVHNADLAYQQALIGTENPSTAWATKTGRAYDRRVRKFWRQFEGQELGDWEVHSVNRRLGEGVQPDLVLINHSSRTINVHDVTSSANPGHLAKGDTYAKFFRDNYSGYSVEYTESYWSAWVNTVEATNSAGVKYLPGATKP